MPTTPLRQLIGGRYRVNTFAWICLCMLIFQDSERSHPFDIWTKVRCSQEGRCKDVLCFKIGLVFYFFFFFFLTVYCSPGHRFRPRLPSGRGGPKPWK